MTVHQVVGLHFACDDECVALARKAAASGLSERDIKKAVARWMTDDYRV